jgi:hypothetical protein
LICFHLLWPAMGALCFWSQRVFAGASSRHSRLLIQYTERRSGGETGKNRMRSHGLPAPSKNYDLNHGNARELAEVHTGFFTPFDTKAGRVKVFGGAHGELDSPRAPPNIFSLVPSQTSDCRELRRQRRSVLSPCVPVVQSSSAVAVAVRRAVPRVPAANCSCNPYGVIRTLSIPRQPVRS